MVDMPKGIYTRTHIVSEETRQKMSIAAKGGNAGSFKIGQNKYDNQKVYS